MLLLSLLVVVADNYDLPVEEEGLVGIMITMVAVVVEAGTTTTTMTIPMLGSSSSRSRSGGQVLVDGMTMMMILMSMMRILPFAVVVVGMVDLKDEINMTKEAGVDEDEGEKEEDGGEIVVVVEEGTIQGAVAVVGGLVAVAAEGEVGEVVGIPLAEVVEMITTTAILVERKDEIADRVNETRHQQQQLHPREQHMEHPPQ